MSPSRRDFLAGSAAGVILLGAGARAAAGPRGKGPTAIIRRPFAALGGAIPAIGLGSWQTFDVPPGEVASVQPVLDRFLELGGRLIDSSPMYGRAEAAIGAMLRRRGPRARGATPLLATKVWTSGRTDGIEQMERSATRLGAERIDLMQVHNLLDWKTHLRTLRGWKERGRVRAIGVTHYQHAAFDDLERIIKTEKIDSVQLPYSVIDRAAERRLLPAARDHGVAVLVLSPFESGALFRKVKGTPVPPWAAEIDCTSWAQLFLKFLLGHPAVTCPLPATSKRKHLEDNMGALRGRLPDPALRRRIIAAVEG